MYRNIMNSANEVNEMHKCRRIDYEYIHHTWYAFDCYQVPGKHQHECRRCMPSIHTGVTSIRGATTFVTRQREWVIQAWYINNRWLGYRPEQIRSL